MKNSLPASNQSYLKPIVVFFMVLSFFVLNSKITQAQIYEPEGRNMPVACNGWNNPSTLPAFASASQAAGQLACMSGHESVYLSYKSLQLATLQKTGKWLKDRLNVKKATAISYLTHWVLL